MEQLSTGELFQALMDACQRHTQAVIYVEGSNPYRFSFNGRHVTIFLRNVHSTNRAVEDEFRIQCPGSLPSVLNRRNSDGDVICVLGYSYRLDVFSAWDPEKFLARNPETNRFSLYTRMTRIADAHRDGYSKYVDSQGQVILQLRSEFLGLYVENLSSLHQATDEELATITGIFGSTRRGSQPQQEVTVDRRKIEVSHVRYSRSPRFRSEVLAAYRDRCAMCGMQLDLVEAAHIVPHAHPCGIDAIVNGLALCSLHHESYDSGLVYFDSSYSILLNDDKVGLLTKNNRSGGLTRFVNDLRNELALPDDPTQHPLLSNIALGNNLRGIGVS